MEKANDKELLNITLDGLPPTINHLYRSAGRRRYKTQEGAAYQQATALQFATQRRGRKPYDGDVKLEITYHSTDKRRWDIDNRVKALQDCLSMAGIIADDKQVTELHVERIDGAEKAATAVTVTAKKGEAGNV